MPVTNRRGRSSGSVLGRGLDTIIQDTSDSVPPSDNTPTRDRVSEIISIRITPQQKELITLYDKYKPQGESFAELFRKQLNDLDRELGDKLREVETESQALARRLLR